MSNDESTPALPTAPTESERRDYRFRIAGDPAEALKVVLAQSE